jgi:hypothetical protein
MSRSLTSIAISSSLVADRVNRTSVCVCVCVYVCVYVCVFVQCKIEVLSLIRVNMADVSMLLATDQ